MEHKVNEKPTAIVTYKTIDTLAFIERIFKESEIEGLSKGEFSQVVNCVTTIKDLLLNQPIGDTPMEMKRLYTHNVRHPLKKNNNEIIIKKGEVNGK